MKDKHYNLTSITIGRTPSIYGVSRATVYRWVESGKLPEPTHLSSRIVSWKRSVLDGVFFGV